MNIEYRIAQMSDLESIYQFAENRLKVDFPDDMQRMIKIWESRFRKESLEHYLKLGWSFIAYEKNSEILQGFFLGQPLLFFEGQTQTLWVETVQAINPLIESELIEISYKLSKDKHFQKVILPEACRSALDSKNIKYLNQSEPWVWCKTTK
jgi:hypothetical protein